MLNERFPCKAHAAADHGQGDGDVFDRLFRDGEDVLVQDHQVRPFAGFQGAQVLLSPGQAGRAGGVEGDGLFNGEGLLRQEGGVVRVAGRAIHGAVDAPEGGEIFYRRVGAAAEDHAQVQQGLPGIGGLGTLRPNAGREQRGVRGNKGGLDVRAHAQSGHATVEGFVSKLAVDEAEQPQIYYVDKSSFKEGDALINTDTGEKYVIGETDTLEGVYCINKGYAVFRRIEILDENEEYAIVSKNTTYGLSRYDHIVRNADKVKEEDILY